MKSIIHQTAPVLALLFSVFSCPAAETRDLPGALPSSPASAPAVSGTIRYHFGPVTEVTLNSDVEGRDYLLDLDTGRVLTPALEMRPERLVNPALGYPTRESCERIWRAYLYGLGVDVINEDNLTGLASCDLIREPAGDAVKWDSLSAEELVRATEGFRQRPAPLVRGTFGPKNSAVLPPHTFLFRTREGNCGILQITEIVRRPKKVSLRFKLVEHSGVHSGHARQAGAQSESPP